MPSTVAAERDVARSRASTNRMPSIIAMLMAQWICRGTCGISRVPAGRPAHFAILRRSFGCRLLPGAAAGFAHFREVLLHVSLQRQRNLVPSHVAVGFRVRCRGVRVSRAELLISRLH